MNERKSLFSWNAGGWFGSQLGCTLWLLILGGILIPEDGIIAGLCILVFALLNAWGLYLWRSRGQLSAYAGIQRFLLAASILLAVVVIVVNERGVSEPPTSGSLVSTYLPYWVIAIPPALMLMFFLRERKTKGN